MRVLHAYTHHRGGGGAENATVATIELLRRSGVEIEVFMRSSEELPGNMAGRLQAGFGALWSAGSVSAFAARLDAFGPDVVHIHDLFPLIHPNILPLCARKGIPVVMSCVHYRLTCPIATHYRDGKVCTLCTGGREHWAVIHNCRRNLSESLVVAAYNKFESWLKLYTRYVDRFVVPAEFTGEWLMEKAGIAPGKLKVISPIVDLPASGVADPAAGRYVAFAGRFVPEKGIETLLEAARISQLPFCLSRNERYPVAVSLPPGVDVRVTRDRSELDDFYRGARLLVFPSIWFETFGLVGAEAMSHGIPVVASRLGALRSLVDEGENGLFFEAGNARDLAAQVTRLWNDPELCRKMGHAARQKAFSQWSADRHLSEMISVYESVCRTQAFAVRA